MKTETRIRKIAAKKVRVVITNKTRNRDGFKVTEGSDDSNQDASTVRFVKTKKEAVSMLLAQIRCSPVRYFTIEPVIHKPNPKHAATLSQWGKKILP